MKKILCLVIAIILMLTCAGCTENIEVMDTVEEKENSSSMFVSIERNQNYGFSIVYHKDTKVMYAICYHGGFTVMLDADGKPLLWEE